MTSVITTAPEMVSSASVFFGKALVETKVIDGCGYIIVNGEMPNRRFDFDDEVILEVRCFYSRRLADRWIERDVVARRSAS